MYVSMCACMHVCKYSMLLLKNRGNRGGPATRGFCVEGGGQKVRGVRRLGAGVSRGCEKERPNIALKRPSIALKRPSIAPKRVCHVGVRRRGLV